MFGQYCSASRDGQLDAHEQGKPTHAAEASSHPNSILLSLVQWHSSFQRLSHFLIHSTSLYFVPVAQSGSPRRVDKFPFRWISTQNVSSPDPQNREWCTTAMGSIKPVEISPCSTRFMPSTSTLCHTLSHSVIHGNFDYAAVISRSLTRIGGYLPYPSPQCLPPAMLCLADLGLGPPT